MFRRIINTLKERPILSIILCVALSEILEFVFTILLGNPPEVYYGITVAALLILFVIPILLYKIEKRKNNRSDDKDDE